MSSDNSAKRFIVAGGGTGGHIYPAIAISKEMLKRYRGSELLYIGGANGMEKDLVPREGLNFTGITVAGFKRKVSLQAFVTVAKAGKGFFQSLSLIRKFRPDVVIGTGGYVSGPVLLAAVVLKKPIVIHEQNVYPGATNRMLVKHAEVAAISWEESRKYLEKAKNVVFTGNPVRTDILEADRQTSTEKMGLVPGVPKVLVFGGSQGAARINEVVLKAAPQIMKEHKVQIVLVTGKTKYDEVVNTAQSMGINIQKGMEPGRKSRLSESVMVITDYMYDMASAMASSDMVICRSGAITLAELTARGIPSILIPHPYVPDNVQEKNARALEAKGAARVIVNDEFTPERLAHEVNCILEDDKLMDKMSKAAYSLGVRDSLSRVSDAVALALKKR